jgi:hypothetical protein
MEENTTNDFIEPVNENTPEEATEEELFLTEVWVQYPGQTELVKKKISIDWQIK